MTKRGSLLYPPFDEARKQTWFKKAMSVERDSLIGLWMHNEDNGVAIDRSGNGLDGVYTNVALGADGVPKIGYTSGRYDKLTSFTNLYSADFNTLFPRAAGTYIQWAKGTTACRTDGDIRRLCAFMAGGNNFFILAKSTTDDTIQASYKAGGNPTENIANSTYPLDVWHPFVLTWDSVADEFIMYIDGTWIVTKTTIGGAIVGNIASNTACIGSSNTTPGNVWDGWLGPALLSSKAFTLPQVAYLS